jgi:hypothetical protein
MRWRRNQKHTRRTEAMMSIQALHLTRPAHLVLRGRSSPRRAVQVSLIDIGLSPQELRKWRRQWE